MRSDLLEPTNHMGRKIARREERRIVRERPEATAIDAAFADDSLPMLIEPTRRRDEAEDPLARRSREAVSEAPLLESLRVQLHALEAQQAQIRRLLKDAGQWRLDPASR